jgi:hypothetical protein
MGEVYGLAAETVAILSSPDDRTDAFLAVVNCPSGQLDNNIERAVQKRADFRAMVRARGSFVQNDYWKRAWILEEINLAKSVTVICGRHQVSFESAAKFALRLENTDGSARRYVYKVFHGQSTHLQTSSQRGQNVGDHVAGELEIFDPAMQKNYRDVPFLDVLHRGRRFNKCQRPVDQLYAKRALASDADILLPPRNVNYARFGNSPRELYKAFAIQYIDSYRDLRIITFACWRPPAPRVFKADRSTRSRIEELEQSLQSMRLEQKVRDRMQNEKEDLEKLEAEMRELRALPSWAPNWTTDSGCWDAAATTDSYGKPNELSALRWTLNTGPRVNPENDDELIVPGRQLAVVTQESLVYSQKVGYAAIKMIGARTNDAKEDWDQPWPGDIVCALKGADVFVCLRSYKDSTGSVHYGIAGRNRTQQRFIIAYQLKEVVDTEMKPAGGWLAETATYGWTFKSLQQVQRLPEMTYRIR